MTFEQLFQHMATPQLASFFRRAKIPVPGFSSKPEKAPRSLLLNLLARDQRLSTLVKEHMAGEWAKNHPELVQQCEAQLERVRADEAYDLRPWLNELFDEQGEQRVIEVLFLAPAVVEGFDELVDTAALFAELHQRFEGGGPDSQETQSSQGPPQEDEAEELDEAPAGESRGKGTKDSKLKAQVKVLQQEAKRLRQEKRNLEREVRMLTDREEQLRAELARLRAERAVGEVLDREYPFPVERVRRMASALFEANRENEELKLMLSKMKQAAAASETADGEEV